MDLSRFSAAPRARLSHLSFEGDKAFPTKCFSQRRCMRMGGLGPPSCIWTGMDMPVDHRRAVVPFLGWFRGALGYLEVF